MARGFKDVTSADVAVQVAADLLDQVFDKNSVTDSEGPILIASTNLAVAKVLQEIRDELRRIHQ